jgi:hypothetical protein
MVEFHWAGREYPVFRLNIDSALHMHINRPPRPVGVPPSVSGSRIYTWDVNRLTFDHAISVGLPFCVPLNPASMTMPNAIRHLARAANIDINGVDLPDGPARLRLSR